MPDQKSPRGAKSRTAKPQQIPRKADLPLRPALAHLKPLDFAEAAALANVSFFQVYRAVQKKELPAHRVGSTKSVRLAVADVLAWAKATPYDPMSYSPRKKKELPERKAARKSKSLAKVA